jgi:cytochrome c551/c552
MKWFTFFVVGLIQLPLIGAPDGEALFKANCAACHMLDQMIVGPSLVEMRGLYLNKPDEFVKWCIAPGKKRPNVIEMPSMVHVGDEGLRAIYTHIMKVSVGAKEQIQKKGDPYIASPTQAQRPAVQRIFMPQAGPAAIAVAVDQDSSLCWDAGECRLRYVWEGGFIDGYPYWQGNGSSVAKIQGVISYVEEKSLFQDVLQGAVKFHGYQKKNELPIFRYNIGETKITEGFTTIPSGKGFQRTFTVTPALTAPLVIALPKEKNVTITCDQGSMEGTNLIIPAAASSQFTLSFSFP